MKYLEQVLRNNQWDIDFCQYSTALMLYADDFIWLEYWLQADLDVMQNYSNQWKLNIHVNKSKMFVYKYC